jgi:hypothetical protein
LYMHTDQNENSVASVENIKPLNKGADTYILNEIKREELAKMFMEESRLEKWYRICKKF